MGDKSRLRNFNSKLCVLGIYLCLRGLDVDWKRGCEERCGA